MGNGKAKELICTTHGHEVRQGAGGILVGGVCRVEGGVKGRKKWDNCSSIINKIYFKKEKKKVAVPSLTTDVGRS